MRRMKKEHLIPIEKSKRVIYLKKRGRRNEKMPISSVILIIVGIICLLYCAAIGLFTGFGTKFFVVWGLVGAVLCGLGLLTGRTQFPEYIPGWFKLAFTIIIIAAALLFIIIEGMILSKFNSSASGGADYVIVLGAQIKENGPSEVLRQRLDRAVRYLKENEEAFVIVSGGQGVNEPMTEALGMYEYLVAAGISESRILQEDQSVNTNQNLEFSARLIEKEDAAVVIITSDFHIFRALLIAQKAGYEQVSGLAADSTKGMLPNNMLREFFGVVKDFLVGNI